MPYQVGSKNSPRWEISRGLFATRHKTVCKKVREKLSRKPRRMIRSECEKKEMRGKNQDLALRIEMEPSFATGSLTFLNNRIICYTIPSRKGRELKIKKENKIKICSNSSRKISCIHCMHSVRICIATIPIATAIFASCGVWVCLTLFTALLQRSSVWQRVSGLKLQARHSTVSKRTVAKMRSAQHWTALALAIQLHICCCFTTRAPPHNK